MLLGDNMKKLFILISMAVFVGITSPLYAITVTEDFSFYGDSANIIGVSGGGTNWDDDWVKGHDNITFVTDAGLETGKLTTSTSVTDAHRTFNTTLTSIDSISIQMKQSAFSAGGGFYGGFQLASDTGVVGIWMSFYSASSNLNLRGFETYTYPSGTGKNLADVVTTGEFHTITITDVDFGEGTYTAQLDAELAKTDFKFYNNADISNFKALNLVQGNTGTYTNFNEISINGVPEPSTYALFGLGLFGLAYFRGRNKRLVSRKL